MSFVHLHVHSEYSLLDGACRLTRLVDTAVKQGANAIAVTDHAICLRRLTFTRRL